MDTIKNQRQYSDKNVYNNIDHVLKKIIDGKINLGQKEIIHFVGIGGIGMSGLAQIMKNMGLEFKVLIKTKQKYSKLYKRYQSIYRSFKKKRKSSTILVRSSAIKNNNSEIRYRKKIPIYSRAGC